jgi:subtilisin family serine protease
MPDLQHLLRLDALAGRTGRGVRVAIIDSGVHAAHPHVQGVAGGVGIDASGLAHDDFVDRLGHGTAVSAVIREKAPAAEVYAVKVFDRELATTGAALVAALQWARRQSIHIVNLSLGTTSTSHEAALAHEVGKATAAGVLIVAAGPDERTRWLPGSLPAVVAVHLDSMLSRDDCEIAIASDGAVTVRAAGYPRPIPGVPPERNLKGLSFAVANASGLLARLFEGAPPGTTISAALGRLNSTSPSG